MAKWNKVILSGSSAHVSSLTASNGILATGDLNINGYLSASLNDGYIYIGNTSNKSFPRLMSGDMTISNTGVATIKPTLVFDTTAYGGSTISTSAKLFASDPGNSDVNRTITYSILRTNIYDFVANSASLNASPFKTGGFTGSFSGSLSLLENRLFIGDNTNNSKQLEVTGDVLLTNNVTNILTSIATSAISGRTAATVLNDTTDYFLIYDGTSALKKVNKSLINSGSFLGTASYALTASYVTPGASLTYWTESENTFSGLTHSKFTPKTGTDVGVILQPKGLGSVIVSTPDGTSAGGNTRGSNAIDLQVNRINATQVASGDASSILGGWKNKISASGNYSAIVNGEDNYVNEESSFIGAGAGNIISSKFSAVVAGSGSTIGVTSDHSFIGGGQSNNIYGDNNDYGVIGGGKTNNILDGQYASILGGEWNTTSASYSSVIGGAQARTTRDYTVAFASGKVNNENDGLGYAQTEFVNLTNRGNPAAPTTPFRLAQNSDLANWLRLRDNETITFKGIITAKEEGSSNRASFEINGCIFRDTGAASTLLIDSNVIEITNVPGWSVAITANVTEGALVITFTPTGAGDSVRVNCSLMYNNIMTE